MSIERPARHVCNRCKRKLYEKDLQKQWFVTRYGKEVWMCARCLMEGKNAYRY